MESKGQSNDSSKISRNQYLKRGFSGGDQVSPIPQFACVRGFHMNQLHKLFKVIQEIIFFFDLFTRESFETLGVEVGQIVDQLKGILVQLDQIMVQRSNHAILPQMYRRKRNVRLLGILFLGKEDTG